MKYNILIIVCFHTIFIDARSLITKKNAIYQDCKGTLCQNTKTLKLFSSILNKLNIKEKIYLFETVQMHNHSACYNLPNKSIILNKQYWNSIPVIMQKMILYHEFRHHKQNKKIPNDTTKTVYEILQTQNFTLSQALEYDADLFAAFKATNGCPVCLRFLKSTANTGIDSRGYFTKHDFTQLIKYAQIKNRLCSRHKK